MPVEKGDMCLVIVSKEFGEIARLEWWPKGLMESVHEHPSKKVSLILGQFVTEDAFGNLWIKFQGELAPAPRQNRPNRLEAKRFQVRIPREAVISIISNPTVEGMKTFGFETSKNGDNQS